MTAAGMRSGDIDICYSCSDNSCVLGLASLKIVPERATIVWGVLSVFIFQSKLELRLQKLWYCDYQRDECDGSALRKEPQTLQAGQLCSSLIVATLCCARCIFFSTSGCGPEASSAACMPRWRQPQHVLDATCPCSLSGIRFFVQTSNTTHHHRCSFSCCA